MRKVYRLLRNNRETGPFSIDELKQQDLTASDLVWEEGGASAWYYPSEIPELAGVLAANSGGSPVSSASSVHPAGEIETKAEELRKRALSFSSNQYFGRPTATDDLGPAPQLPGEKEIEIIYHGRQPAVTPSQLIVAGIVGVLLAVGWFGRDLLVPQRMAAARITVTPFVAAEVTRPALPKSAPRLLAADTLTTRTEDQSLAEPQAIRPLARPADSSDPRPIAPPPAAPSIAKTVVEKEPEAKTTEVFTEPSKTEEPELKTAETRTEEASAEEPRERKTLGQAIRGIFKKKKKD